MRVWLQNTTAVLWTIGLALNFVFAISQLWGWHPFLAWSSSIVLAAIAWDERRGIRLSLCDHGKMVDRLFAYYLIILCVTGLLINTVIALASI